VAYDGLPPDEALATLRVEAGFRVELVAHEPDVADPVAIAWDRRGQLWVAGMGDYPAESPAGRVRRLVDTDGDGRPDRSIVFAAGLAAPTSVLPHGDGVLVCAAPDILYLEDIDLDGRADVRRVVLTGFGLGTTQLRVNSLLRGLDGRIYGANGRSGGRIRRPEDPPEKAVDIAQRDFRFDPESLVVEATAGPSQFGQAFDAWGRRFLSWNTIHIRQEVISPRDLERHPHLDRTEVVAPISDHGDSARLYALTPPPRTFNSEPTDHFNASCGIAIEAGGIFPEPYAGSAFVCEPLVGIVHRDRLLRLDAGKSPVYTATRGEAEREFLASSDPWFHPVNLQSGPDGALYVVDFYREMVEHPDYVPRELRGGIDFTRGAAMAVSIASCPRAWSPCASTTWTVSRTRPSSTASRARTPAFASWRVKPSSNGSGGGKHQLPSRSSSAPRSPRVGREGRRLSGASTGWGRWESGS